MWTIAKNTIKEFVRNRLVYTILGVSFLFIFFSIVVINLALTEGGKVLIDFNLFFIELFGLISTLFLASYLIYNEINKNTILVLLSKNPSRKDFIIGKFIGFSVILALIYLILSLAFMAVYLISKKFYNIDIDLNFYHLLAIFFSYIKILIILAFIIFFSTFASPFVALLASLSIYIIAHAMPFVKFYTWWKTKGEGIENYIVTFIYYLFPNFQDLSLKDYLISPFLGNYSFSHIILTILSSLFYIIILLTLSVIIFKKKEF